MLVCYVFSLESSHRGHSNKYKQHTSINITKKITLNYSKYSKCLQLLECFLRTQEQVNKFEIAVVNEPSVFEPMVFYCIVYTDMVKHRCDDVLNSRRKVYLKQRIGGLLSFKKLSFTFVSVFFCRHKFGNVAACGKMAEKYGSVPMHIKS